MEVLSNKAHKLIFAENKKLLQHFDGLCLAWFDMLFFVGELSYRVRSPNEYLVKETKLRVFTSFSKFCLGIADNASCLSAMRNSTNIPNTYKALPVLSGPL